MFDIGFSELLLVFVIGLLVLGPERLPIAVKKIAGWIRTLRGFTASLQHEINQELKLQDLEESLKKIQQVELGAISPQLKASLDELQHKVEELQQPKLERTTIENSDILELEADNQMIDDQQSSKKTNQSKALQQRKTSPKASTAKNKRRPNEANE